MYVATFYSYKGGVGRSMALVNIAVLLARAGKKVLIVDFDLEAPGIPSVDLFRNADRMPGLVDYVCAYRETGRVPNVGDFITKCASDYDLPLWLMPAGRHTLAGYGEKLYSIDWKELYEDYDGYLMFEDLRYQWSRHPADFDYVLIDSRTGHTDVGGICTRQLPNAVVVMFLPNEQNIEGLKPIVSAIHEQNEDDGARKIHLHFCPSNVPDLDDEDDILSDMMHLARSEFGPLEEEIHHYNSLDLLTLKPFVEIRPNSKLARQYGKLRDAIVERNFEDEVGAERALERMPDRYERARVDGDQTELRHIEEAASRIRLLHPDNGKLGWLLSIVYSRMGAVRDEKETLSLAIDQGYQTGRAIIRRARLLSSIGHPKEAIEDLHRLLGSGTTVFELLPAIDLLRAIDRENWVKPVQSAIDQLQANTAVYAMLMKSLMVDREKLPIAARAGQRALAVESGISADLAAIRSNLVLSYIGMGDFQLAIDRIGQDRAAVLAKGKAHEVFNFAIAQWGLESAPPLDLFERVLTILDSDAPVKQDTNLFQCRALTEMVLGRSDAALASLDTARSCARAGTRDFSCWRYLWTTGAEMLADLDAMAEVVASGSEARPPFFDEVRRLVD